MEKPISAADANRTFSQLLRGVRAGDSYVVTNLASRSPGSFRSSGKAPLPPRRARHCSGGSRGSRSSMRGAGRATISMRMMREVALDTIALLGG